MRTVNRVDTLMPCKASRPYKPMDADVQAKCIGLRYQLDDIPGITRKKVGGSFQYLDHKEKPLKNAAHLQRISALVIPPAWENVWISPFSDAHLQATGIDARGRKQYKYHVKWRQTRDQSKFEKLIAFAECLPAIRSQVYADLSKSGLPREKVLATVVRLIETTCIRVGNENYARENESYGLTTLRNHHVQVCKCEINFKFTGKSGKKHNISLTDCHLAKIVHKCRASPGDLLFQYVDENRILRRVSSTDVNRYLRKISGQSITAKDFRTWWGTVLAALVLREKQIPQSDREVKREINAAVKDVATHLGNTPAVCRKAYIHPAILDAYAQGRSLGRIVKKTSIEETPSLTDLLPEESAVRRFLKSEWKRQRRTVVTNE